MTKQFHRWVQAFALAVIFILLKGYSFNTDDQAEHLPQVYQMLDPELYPHDYFVNASNSIFTVRFYYEWLIYGGAQVMSVATWCFVLMLFFTSLMTYSIQRIYETLLGSDRLSWLAPLLALLVFNSWTVGGNGIFGTGLICSLIAKSIATLGLWRFLKHDQVGSGISLGLATLFQPLVGLQLMLIEGFALLTRFKISEMVKLGLSFMIVSAPMMVPLLSRQAGISGEEPQLFWDVMYRFRNYLHYLPSLFPATHFVKSGIMLALAVGLTQFLNAKAKDLILRMMFGIVLGLSVYTVCLEVLGFNSIGKTQWFKTTIWIALIGAVAVSGLVASLVSVKLSMPSSIARIAAPSIGMLGLVIILNSVQFPWLPNKVMVGNYQLSDQERMHQWISQNTRKNAVFLVPPNAYDFQCQAKRSIPIGFKAIIHEPEFMLNWYQNFQHIYGIGLEDVNGEKTEVAATEEYNRVQFAGSEPAIEFRLDNVKTCKFLGQLGPIVHQEGDWILTEFRSNSAN